MKLSLLIPLLLLLVVTPVFGALSDATGLVNNLDVEASGHTFEVKTVTNFAISDFDFDKDKKRLTLYIDSGLENNLGEIIIPKNLLGGNFTFYLNEQEYLPKIKSNEKISFVTLNFTGSGANTLEIFGTTYLDGLSERTEVEFTSSLDNPSVDYDYGLIYIMILVVGIIGVSIFVIKKRK